MGVVNTLSTGVTNADAAPRVMNDPVLHGGTVQVIKDVVEIAAADDDTSTYRVARVKSGWNIHSIRIENEAITGGTDFNLGLYHTAANGGAAIDDNCYADAIDLSTAGLGEVAFEARDRTSLRNKVWQDANAGGTVYTADPKIEFDLVLTGVTVGSGAGSVAVIIEYTDGN